MKIIHINFSLDNGGLENMMVDIAGEQYRMGHQVAMVVINHRVDRNVLQRIHPGIKLFLIGRGSAWSVFAYMRLFRVLRKLADYDIIHSHAAALGRYLKQTAGKKRVVTLHSLGQNVTHLPLYDKVFAISHTVKADVESRSSISPVVVYNGIKTGVIRRRERKAGKPLRIVQLGRLEHEIKGQDLLLHALSHITKEAGNKTGTEITLDFIGEGRSRKALEDLCSELSLTGSVRFLGNKPRQWVYEHLAEYDILVHPARYEGFGLAVAEAMAAKVPVIAVEAQGPAEILGQGKYGGLFEHGNAADLSASIKKTIQLIESEEILKITKSAYSHCLENFDIGETVSSYVSEYHKLLMSCQP